MFFVFEMLEPILAFAFLFFIAWHAGAISFDGVLTVAFLALSIWGGIYTAYVYAVICGLACIVFGCMWIYYTTVSIYTKVRSVANKVYNYFDKDDLDLELYLID